MGRRDLNRSLASAAVLSGLFVLTSGPVHAQSTSPAPASSPSTSPAPASSPSTSPAPASSPSTSPSPGASADTATPADKTPSDAPSAASSDNPVERARVHYDRGLQLFKEENYQAALFEFERAYELAPTYLILYNMGRIQRAQNNYAAALRSYERYLREGGSNIAADRRAAVESEIALLKPRVAALRVTVNVDDADVYTDDVPVCTATIESSCVGKSPLRSPVLVNAGRHKVTATKPGYAPATSIVSVVGSDVLDVKLDLVKYAQAKAERRVPWGGWITTGVLLAGAGVFGYFTLSESSKLSDERAQANADPDSLESRSSRTTAFGLVADGLTIGAIAAGVISTYYTIKWRNESSEPKDVARAPTRKGVSFTPSLTGGAFTF